jgi:YesN/AraC family two-component response regulator
VLVNLLGGRYIVYEAANGHDALKVLEQTDEIDLVLSDIMMPGMDGHELLRKIRSDERFEGLPVVFLTARADSFMKIEGLDLGAIDYVTKPFNTGELILRIRNQMEQKRLRNRLRRNYESLIARLKLSGTRNAANESIDKIENVCAFIKENYMHDLTRDELADSAGLNPDTFSRIFNQHTGKTLLDYINEIRIEEAKLRLAGTADPVTRICIDTGFENIRTFNRVFKKLTGVTPGEFRGSGELRN